MHDAGLANKLRSVRKLCVTSILESLSMANTRSGDKDKSAMLEDRLNTIRPWFV